MIDRVSIVRGWKAVTSGGEDTVNKGNQFETHKGI